MKFLRLSVFVMAVFAQAAATGGGHRLGTSNYGSSSANYGGRRTSSATFRSGSSVNYGGSNRFTSTESRGSTSSRGFVGVVSGGFSKNEAAQPYNFDYISADQQGNSHYHREESDASGTVRGSYGYTDVQGLYRVVDYIAGASGFRASIRTNEPGTDGKENPADVQMTVDKPPAGIQDRYTKFSGTGGATRTDGGAYGGASGGYRGGYEGSYGGYGGTGGDSIYPTIGQLYTPGDGSSENLVSGGGVTNTGSGGGVRTGKSGY